MPAAARIGDLHQCPIHTHVGGPIQQGSPTVQIGGLPAARVGDLAGCNGPPDAVVVGTPTVLIDHMPAARQGDPTAHGGVVATGCSSVLIGMSAQAAVLVQAADQGAPFCEECARAQR